MRRGWLNRWMMVALATVLFASGCEHSTSEPRLETPEETVEQTTDLISGGHTLIRLAAPQAPVPTVVHGSTDQVNGLLGGLVGIVIKVVNVVFGVIGLDGGILTLQQHALVVPAGAVLVPTGFKMELIPNDHVMVDLGAYVLGQDVGEKGFEKPVTLTLSYANANVKDPSKLYILRYNENGQHEKLPSVVDPVKKTVSAQLDHFSKYCMATN